MASQNKKKAEYKNQRNRHHELLMGLKSTVEGLLATPTSNVWSTYGGLDRVCLQLEKIFTHRLLDKSEVNDFWPFIKEVKWQDPVLDPFIERINRSSPNQDGFSKGQVWLRESLHYHTISNQLNTLVHNQEILLQYYHEDAFLCNPKYVQALLICLYSIERNKVTLLAEINPVLLTLRSKLNENKPSEPVAQSAPLPIRNHRASSVYDGMERTKREKTPPYASPKRARALLGYSQAQAVPIPSSEEIGGRAKDAMRSVLDRSGADSPVESPPRSFSFYDSINSDPLLNFEFTGTRSELSLSTSHLANIESKPRDGSPPESKDCVDGKTSCITDKQITEKSHSLVKSLSLDDGHTCDLTTSTQEGKLTQNSKPAPVPANPPTSTLNPEQTSLHVPLKVKPAKTNSPKPSHKRCRSDIPFVKDSHTIPSRTNLLTTKSNSFTTDDKTAQNKAAYQQPDLVYSSKGHFLTHPAPGQSLMSFLSSQDFHTCANLDRENAHFSISEILISAIEQMKWKHVIAPPNSSDLEDGDSDEEIQRLKQRIRIRRRERMKEKARGFPAFSDGRTDTPSPSADTSSTNTSSSSSPCTSMLPLLQSDSSESSDGIDDQEIELSITDRSENSSLLKSSGLSLSMASLYSDADLFQRNMPAEKMSVSSAFESCNSSQVSAESVAISLLKKFSEKQLPKASDLQWMVSEKDAPQALLPLPNSYPISPDDGEYADLRNRTRLRGNLEWAPPRPQIIFSIHSSSKRSVTIPKQNYRCAGCGTRVEPAYMKRFRYCEYLGKYFCQCCHTNASAFIPGRILQKWDFSKYYVSKFSFDLLAKIFNEPFFNLEDINPVLYRKVKALENIKQFRQQLVHLATLMKICRHASTTIYPEIEKLPTHLMREIHTYSIADLIRVKNGELLPLLKNIVTTGISHVKECEHCQCLGFICELCNNEHDIIFPFQLSKAINCPDCKACYHQNCFIPQKCPKCARIAMRKKLQQQRSMDIEEEEDNG
ncbi:RUBCN [Acanthosepion pharaonis]|uniref:RUBCN n=1 Tax=Acanthosepion pharaonis TaxID=158019 RepID=A0A812C6Y5_ACAPH|nr:RUBCN [Sepia pharaonis]